MRDISRYCRPPHTGTRDAARGKRVECAQSTCDATSRTKGALADRQCESPQVLLKDVSDTTMPPAWAVREAERARQIAAKAENGIFEKAREDRERQEREAEQAAAAKAKAEADRAAADAARAAERERSPAKRQKTSVDRVAWAGWQSGESQIEALLKSGKWPDGRRVGKGHQRPFLQPSYARAIADGSKTVEGRARKGWAATVAKDDWIKFTITSNGPKLVVRVLEVRKFESFDAMLEDCTVEACLPGFGGGRAAAVKLYRNFGASSSSSSFADSEASHGVVAFDVAPLVAPDRGPSCDDEEEEPQEGQDVSGAHDSEGGAGSDEDAVSPPRATTTAAAAAWEPVAVGGIGTASDEQPKWDDDDDDLGW